MNRDTGLLQLYSTNDVFVTYTLFKIDFNLNIETERNEIETFAFLLTLDCIKKNQMTTQFSFLFLQSLLVRLLVLVS